MRSVVGVKDEHASARRDGELASCEQRAMLFRMKTNIQAHIYIVSFRRPQDGTRKEERRVPHLRVIKDEIREEDQVEKCMRGGVWVCGVRE